MKQTAHCREKKHPYPGPAIYNAESGMWRKACAEIDKPVASLMVEQS